MLPKLLTQPKNAESSEPLYIDVDDSVYPTTVQRSPSPINYDNRLIRLTRIGIVAVFCLFLFIYTPFIIKRHVHAEQSPLPFESSPSVDFSNRFLSYMKKFKKEYASPEETLRAFTAYEKNVRLMEEQQKDHPDVLFGENEMSDWSDEEFAKTLLPASFYRRLRAESSFIRHDPPVLERATPQPDHFDWRAFNVVTPVKAQGKCGSCWAFAATATVEAAWAISHGAEQRILSEQTLLDCDLSNDACDGGNEDKAFRFIHREGLAYLADYPYVAHRQNTCLANSNRTKLQTAYFLHPDEKSMIDWLVNFGPVNIGMSVIQPMRSYKGGVFHPSVYACKNEVIGLHAMLVVGYGTSEKGEKYWIIKNSWGASFGVEDGYIYFARGVNACFVEDEPVGILA